MRLPACTRPLSGGSARAESADRRRAVAAPALHRPQHGLRWGGTGSDRRDDVGHRCSTAAGECRGARLPGCGRRPPAVRGAVAAPLTACGASGTRPAPRRCGAARPGPPRACARPDRGASSEGGGGPTGRPAARLRRWRGPGPRHPCFPIHPRRIPYPLHADPCTPLVGRRRNRCSRPARTGSVPSRGPPQRRWRGPRGPVAPRLTSASFRRPPAVRARPHASRNGVRRRPADGTGRGRPDRSALSRWAARPRRAVLPRTGR